MRVLGLIILVLVGASSFFFFKDHELKELSQETKNIEDEKYYNERYGFSMELPDGVRVHEIKEGRDSVTVRIEDELGGRGFQVFVLPYAKEEISEEQFLRDIPSGVRKQEEMLELGGVPAVAFISEDFRLGEVREVWMLHGGYLYEITAPLASDAWVESILQTFLFE